MRKLITALILLGIFLPSSPAPAATVEERIDFYTSHLLKLAPPYVWGGAWGPLGNDCSGAMAWIHRMAGVPVPRTTALAMWNGAWPGVRLRSRDGAREEARFPNLIFFDYKVDRPRGHVGLIRWNVMLHKKRNLMMAEASWSKKMFKETLILEGDGRWRATHGVLKVNLKMGAGAAKQ